MCCELIELEGPINMFASRFKNKFSKREKSSSKEPITSDQDNYYCDDTTTLSESTISQLNYCEDELKDALAETVNMIRYYECHNDDLMFVSDEPKYAGLCQIDVSSNTPNNDIPTPLSIMTNTVIDRIEGGLNSIKVKFTYNQDYKVRGNESFLFHPSYHPNILISTLKYPNPDNSHGKEQMITSQIAAPGENHRIKIPREDNRNGKKRPGRPTKSKVTRKKVISSISENIRPFDYQYKITFKPWAATEEHMGMYFPEFEDMEISVSISTQEHADLMGISQENTHLIWDIIRSLEIILEKCQPDIHITFEEYSVVLSNYRVIYPMPLFYAEGFDNLAGFSKNPNGKMTTSNPAYSNRINVHNLHKIMGSESNGDFHRIPINGKLRSAMMDNENEKMTFKITWIEYEDDVKIIYNYTIRLQPTGKTSALNAKKKGIAEQIVIYLFMIINTHKRLVVQTSVRKIKCEENAYLNSYCDIKDLNSQLKKGRLSANEIVPDVETIEEIRKNMLEYFAPNA